MMELLAALVTGVIIWVVIYYSMPRGKKGNLSIILAIVSETSKQSNRIRKDLAGNINEMLRSHNLCAKCNLVILNEHQSTRITKMIHRKLDSKPEEAKFTHKLFRLVTKYLRYKMIVYGEIKERKQGDNNFIIKLNTIVMLDKGISQRLADMYSRIIAGIWKPQIVFPESIELVGFPMVGDYLFVCAIFIIGSVLPLSDQLDKSIDLLESVRHSHVLDDNQYVIMNRSRWDNLIDGFLMRSYLSHARQAFFDKNYATAHESVIKSIVVQKCYDALILRAITEYKHLNNPIKALSTIAEAEPLSKGNRAWMFSRAFLLMHLGNLDDSYHIYERLTKRPNPAEDEMVHGVYEFIQDYLKENNDRFEFHFVLGFLKYKRDTNFAEGLLHMKQFMACSSKCQSDLLQKRGKIYLDELKRMIR
ncbi:MAG: hypothetical protein Q8M92_01515 [Candidatus Subteraquimicrobiales bacterium]|nr:hypothetical protein [Candidatus Subteraquimicrobiales bacterium]